MTGDGGERKEGVCLNMMADVVSINRCPVLITLHGGWAAGAQKQQLQICTDTYGLYSAFTVHFLRLS